MEKHAHFTEPLLERVEQYRNTSIEIIKLKTIDKTAEIASALISRIILILVLSIVVMALTIAAAYWIGTLLGKTHYGFLVVGGFYAFVSLLLLMLHPAMKRGIHNVIIRKFLN